MNIGDASLKTRKYAKGDAKIVLQSIEEMREMVDQLNVRYRIYAYAEQSAQLSSMEEAAKRRTLQ